MAEIAKCSLLLAAILFSNGYLGQEQSHAPRSVGIIELLANPAKYQNQLVSVTAFLGFDLPDGSMLYLHTVDYENGLLLNGMSVEISRQMLSDREKLDTNYVTITGTFQSGEGTGNRYSRLTSVRTCSLWSQPENPIRKKLDSMHKHGSKEGSSQEPDRK